MNKLDVLMDVFARNLREDHSRFPQDYAYAAEKIPSIVERMRGAVEQGSFLKDSRAFKRTCKELGIKNTYTAIREFIESRGNQ